MLYALSIGTVLGLSAGLAPGPLLTLVVTQTLRHGVKEGIKVAAAPLVTDLPIVLVSLLVLSRLSELDLVLGLISLVGGGYILYLAYESFRPAPTDTDASGEEPRSLRRGTLVNFLNPHPYLFWITVGAPFILKSWEEGPLAPALFILSFYLLLVGSKVLLAMVVGKSRAFLTGKAYLFALRLLAVMLLVFGLVLIKESFAFIGIIG